MNETHKSYNDHSSKSTKSSTASTIQNLGIIGITTISMMACGNEVAEQCKLVRYDNHWKHFPSSEEIKGSKDFVLYDYDGESNRTSETEYEINLELFVVDVFNPKLNSHITQKKRNTYSYDDRNNLIEEVWWDNWIIKYTYDHMNNVLTEVLTESRELADGEEDPRVSKITYQYAYDEQGNMLSKHFNSISSWLKRSQVETWSYDKEGNVLRRDITTSGKREIWTYDDNGNILRTWTESQWRPDGQWRESEKWVYVYDDDGKLLKQSRDGHVRAVYTYDDQGRLRRVDSKDDGVWTYTYDERGNILSETSWLNTPTWAPEAESFNAQYTYDAENNLRSMIKTYLSGQATHTYDVYGNRVSKNSYNRDSWERREAWDYDCSNVSLAIKVPVQRGFSSPHPYFVDSNKE